MSTTYFVTTDWLAAHLSDTNVQILDARMAQPGQTERDMPYEYQSGHLPGALFFDIEALSDTNNPLPHMMPRPEDFAVAMCELGVCDDKHLVIYDEGNLFSAPRAWWMLRQFGAEHVSILAGGLAEWQRRGLALEQGEIRLPNGRFHARFDSSVVKRLPDMMLASHEVTAQIIDARSAPRFQGEVDEPRQGLRRGHIPGAYNIPWTDVVNNGQLKTTDQLQVIFSAQKIDLTKPIIASCGSGVTAAVLILALETLGVKNVPLYDGSWCEWGACSDTPVAPV